MTTEIRISPNVLRCGVTSSESPTVPNAEVPSNKAGKSSNQSETMSARVLRRTSKDTIARMESAREIKGRGSVRQKSVILTPDLGNDDEDDEREGRHLYAPAGRGRGRADEHEYGLHDEGRLAHLGVAYGLKTRSSRRHALEE